MRNPWPTLRPRHGQVPNKLQYSEPRYPGKSQKRQNDGSQWTRPRSSCGSHLTAPVGSKGRISKGRWDHSSRSAWHAEIFSPVPVPCNLHHPSRRGRMPGAGRRSQFSIQRRELGAAQTPARTHNVPSPANSSISDTQTMGQRAI